MTPMIDLLRYEREVHPEQVSELLSDPSAVQVTSVGGTIDPDIMNEIADQFANTPYRQRTAMDSKIVRLFHQSMPKLPRRTTTDMRFWHWLCLVPFKKFVVVRWLKTSNFDIPESMPLSRASRFVGTRSLHGVSRNALARIWWCAETLRDGDDYSLAEKAISNQDFFQQSFERKFGLNKLVAKAYFEELSDASKDQRRIVGRKLNHFFTTTSGAYADEEITKSLIHK